MANANTPRGLQPYANIWGQKWTGAVKTFYVPSGNATALYLGDPVLRLYNNSDGNGIPVAEIATGGASNPITGAFMGISNNAGQTTIPLLQSQTPYLAAGQAAYIYVTDDPFLLYWCQEDSAGGTAAIPSNSVGQNFNLLAGAGSTVTSQSGWQINSASTTTHGTGSDVNQVRLIEALQEVDNAVGTSGTPDIGLYCKWLVQINQNDALNRVAFPGS